MEILSKDTIKKYILPNLSVGSRGKSCCESQLLEIVSKVLYRLKTGCQWRYLPSSLEKSLTWQGIYYHFNKWVKDGSWQKVWLSLLRQHHKDLDLSCIQLDGSHCPTKRGGEAVGYQNRKSCKTTNMLYICDNQGQMLACATPQEGQHHDLYEIKTLFSELCALLEEAGISLKGLFMNADAGFDSQELRQICNEKEIEANIDINPRNTKTKSDDYQYFDEELYKRRTVIEQANAWMDSFKALLVRFETKAKNWITLNLIAFSVRLLWKIPKKK